MTTNLQQEIAAIRSFGEKDISGEQIAYSGNLDDTWCMRIRDGLLTCSIDMYSLKNNSDEFDVDEWEREFIHLSAVPSKEAAYYLARISRIAIGNRVRASLRIGACVMAFL